MDKPICPQCGHVKSQIQMIEASAAVDGGDVYRCVCGHEYTDSEAWKAMRLKRWRDQGSPRIGSERWTRIRFGSEVRHPPTMLQATRASYARQFTHQECCKRA